MNKIASGDIKRGMRFSAPVFFDDGKNMFLAEGKSAKSYHVASLERWQIPFLLTNGHEMKGEELSRYLANAKKKAAPPPLPKSSGGHKANAKVNMEDTADVTDMFADVQVSSDEGESEGSDAGAGTIETIKAEHEIDAEDVTSMFM